MEGLSPLKELHLKDLDEIEDFCLPFSQGESFWGRGLLPHNTVVDESEVKRLLSDR